MIDFHCHLDLYPNPVLIARKSADEEIYVLSVTTTPKAWQRSSAIAVGYTRIRTALGFHPELAHERKNELSLFRKLLPKTRYIGEIGLDGSPEQKTYFKDQLFVFSEILNASANAGGRVMSIHSRRAVDQVLDELSKTPDAGLPILHWFTGNQTQLKRAIDMGCWFSIGPGMLSSARTKELVSKIPQNRILPETDGPFTKIRGKATTPIDSWYVVEKLAYIYQVSYNYFVQQLKTNLSEVGKFAIQ